MKITSKKLFAKARGRSGQQAHDVSVSLYPQHRMLLARRERELNIHRSIILQVLLEIEGRDGLLRRKLISRLKPSAAPATRTTK